jgi:dipeptidyl aminopeptidase/acylaminoacyl peptidase
MAVALVAAGAAWGQVAPADYARSEGLREAWMYLTKDVADPAHWIGNTSEFVYRKTVPGGFAFVVMDARTGQKRPAFDHARLAAGLGKAAGATYTALRLPFTDVLFSGDQSAITARAADALWRCRVSDYVCAAMPAGRGGQPRGFGVVRDLTVPADNTPKRSPDGRWEAYVNNFNVVMRPAGGGSVTILSRDGSPDDFYDPESIVWAPDSKKLAAYRVRPGYHRVVTHVESSPADQLQPKTTYQFYPKPGDPVDIDRPVLFHVEPVKQIAIDDALFPNPYLMSRINWRRDSATFTFEYDQRGHQVYRMIEVDAQSGKPCVVAGDEMKTFVDTFSSRTFHHDVNGLGDEVIWMSERDGWNHLYLYDGHAGKVKNQITRGEWLVREVVRVDDQKRQIWFAAGGMNPGEDPYFQQYYRIDFDGRNLTPLTTANAYHDVAFSADMAFYVDNYSRVDLPNIMELHRAGDGALVKEVERGDIADLTAAGFKPPEVFVAKGRDGKTDIWGVIVRPRNFDASKKYPVVENIYAGPHGSFVPKTFWPFGFQSGGDKVIGMQSMADMGFVAVQIDGMGTLNRSKAFHDVAWKNIADAGFPDRILWHKAAAAKYPWYDASRVGIYGGSAGGQDTLLALLFHPEFYKVGVAYAGCYDNRMDKIGWNEAWMGWPLDESYSASSGVDNAWRLQGHLLMVVGELDENVDPSSTLQVVNALIQARKDFDLIVAPGLGHTALRSSGPIDYGLRRQYDFFLRHLAGLTPPDWNAVSPVTPLGR